MTSPQPIPRLVLLETGDPGVPGLESHSPFCVKVHRGLKVLGLPYERRYGIPSSFKKYNKAKQVPVLLVADEAVSGSADILRRIQQLAGRTFHGTNDPKLEAEAYIWEEYADTCVNGYVVAARWADKRNWALVRASIFRPVPPPMRPLIAFIFRRKLASGLIARDVLRSGEETCWRRFQEQLDALELRAPAEGFWLGRLTSADLALFGQFQNLRLPETPWQRDQVASRKRLSAWLDRVDAYTRQKAPDDDMPRAVAAG
ncbi:glutathione S-transferase family protein [Corallococcus sicarius]|nr:glutathione S-transferase N-terminal domain-containing protein [Corallococcus sicarius]